MIYTPMTVKAMKIAYNAHHGQTDKSGAPYIFHPIHLAEQMPDEKSCAVALLHDVAEDTPVTLRDLEQAGFPCEVLEAVRLLTRDMSVDYMDYIHALKDNEIARRVKLADLRHNSDATRPAEAPEKMNPRLKKYAAAIKLLESE